MDEQTLQMMVALGAIPEEQALLMRQRGTGAEMMGTPMAQGREVGRTYVAASPLEHLSVGLMRAMGARQMQNAEQGFKDSLARQTQGRMAAEQYRMGQEQATQSKLDALLESMRRPQQQTPPMLARPDWQPPEF